MPLGSGAHAPPVRWNADADGAPDPDDWIGAFRDDKNLALPAGALQIGSFEGSDAAILAASVVPAPAGAAATTWAFCPPTAAEDSASKRCSTGFARCAPMETRGVS